MPLHKTVIQAKHPDQSDQYNQIHVSVKFNVNSAYQTAFETACKFGINLFFSLLGVLFPPAKPLEELVQKQTETLCDSAVQLGSGEIGIS